MAAFIRFKSTCFPEHLKVDALFIKQPSYFFHRIFLFKESPKKKHVHISLLAKHKNFDFFKATLSMLNITYIKLICIKAHLGLHWNNQTAVLKK